MKMKVLLVILLIFWSFSCKKTDTASPTVSLPVITEFTATPSSITKSQTATLKWTVSNFTEINISGVGIFTENGTTQVSPQATTTYTLTATNADGTSTRQTAVTVNLNVPTINEFKATPSTIDIIGGQSELYWYTTGATSVRIDGIGDVEAIGTRIVTIIQNTTYNLIATNNDGTTTRAITISVQDSGTFVILRCDKKYKSYGCCYFDGTAKNISGRTVYNVGIDFSAYNSSNTIIDTATGFPADLGNIPSQASANFNAIFFHSYDWALIDHVTFDISWLNASGIRHSQSFTIR